MVTKAAAKTRATSPSGQSPLSLAGLLPGDELLYRAVLRASGASRERITEATALALDELDEVLARFATAGLVRLDGETVIALAPLEVLGEVVSSETQRLQADSARLDALRNLLPGLAAEHATSRAGDGTSVAVQVVEGGDVVALIRALAEETSGDLMWLRPDQWRLPVTREIDALVRELTRAGRRSRAIYPARALEEAPEILRSRAEAGELVRVVASLSTRISVFGSTAALIPERWGEHSARRLVVREHSLVGAIGALFEHTWERAMTVPGLESESADPSGQRRLLLMQLTRGARDEQIARALGISLRTVRRRVAEVMEELGAESRFQAGVEAVRRGWV